MTKRIFAGIISVSLLTMIACIVLLMGVMYDYMGEKIDEEMKNEARLVEAALDGSGPDYLEGLDTAAIRSRITLIAGDGEVLFDSDADSEDMSNHLEREEVQEALAGGEGYAVRHSSTLSEDTRYYAMKMDDGSILRLSTSHYSKMGLVMDTLGVVLAIAVILIAIGALIANRVTKAIIRPINQIDLNEPDIEKNYEEILPLLRRINQQNARIRGQMENLSKQQNEFRIITENMAEGLIIIDREMEVLTYNSSALKMLDAGESAETGTVLRLNRSEAFRQAVTGALAGRHLQTLLNVNESICEIIANPVYDGGQVTGAILIILDVTEKERGEALRREFTSNVSHELKTPQTSIYGVSDMLGSGLVKPEDVTRFAGTIKEESARLISLIEDIIKLSRLDENNVHEEKEPLDVLGVAEEVARRLTPRAEAEKVELSVSGEHVQIMGVESILDEIIYNLCDNAIKYNREGGRVDVHVSSQDGSCLLSVRDTGIGIPKSDLKRVFERFYRVDKSHSKETGGTGLGLSIVKHAVMFLDGRLEIESVENEGTEVKISFKAV